MRIRGISPPRRYPPEKGTRKDVAGRMEVLRLFPDLLILYLKEI